jgi:hypothetical protein
MLPSLKTCRRQKPLNPTVTKLAIGGHREKLYPFPEEMTAFKIQFRNKMKYIANNPLRALEIALPEGSYSADSDLEIETRTKK